MSYVYFYIVKNGTLSCWIYSQYLSYFVSMITKVLLRLRILSLPTKKLRRFLYFYEVNKYCISHFNLADSDFYYFGCTVFIPFKKQILLSPLQKNFDQLNKSSSEITEESSGFSHLNILFIPHTEMASHFSVSPRTGIYNSIKAHESID